MPKAVTWALASALALVLPAITSAQPPQNLKSGLWKIATQIAMLPSPQNAAGAQNAQICVSGPLKVENMVGRRPGSAKGNCTTVRNERTSYNHIQETSCLTSGRTFHTTMTTTTGSEVHFDVMTATDIDGAAKMTAHSTWDWVGQCPSGMKVGQLQPSARP